VVLNPAGEILGDEREHKCMFALLIERGFFYVGRAERMHTLWESCQPALSQYIEAQIRSNGKKRTNIRRLFN
jgi:hypothetical protein